MPVDQGEGVSPETLAHADAGAEAAAALRFCTKCGAPWEPCEEACRACAASPPERGRRDPATGSLKSALFLYFAFISTYLLALIIPDAAAAGITISLLDSIIVLVWMIFSWRIVLPALRPAGSPGWIMGGALTGVASFIIVTLLVSALVWITGVEEVIYSDAYLDAGYSWWFIILIVSIQPAVIEELAFRGIILPGLQRALSTPEAIIVSALMFMVMHLAVLSFPHLFLLGLALGWLRIRSGSLYPCIVLHFVHNSLCVLSEAWWN